MSADETTIANVRCAVMNAVFDDRERSLESAVERAILAGIEFERARVASILEKVTPRPGLEKALIILAFQPSTTVESAAQFMETYSPEEADCQALRRSLRVVVDNSEQVKANTQCARSSRQADGLPTK
ncbi:hypothetical protein QA640_17665 [Bradyrhizobium sp. CB82]|uniref:hypothetical protein n=1 Tax=Bradyrhizobium sp. CB82 TaxID=3039159 RepID=UPI0024B075D1|nr:hypothetical protein [Bradyrhizobium sp. CB82]WFU44112.1 hypothetical protein QA640_17665 [Bradyrhizobium sp. CB82]